MIWCNSIVIIIIIIIKGITERNVKEHYIEKLTKCFLSSNPKKIDCSNTFIYATIAEKRYVFVNKLGKIKLTLPHKALCLSRALVLIFFFPPKPV